MTLDLDAWFARSSTGYSGKGSRPQGLEHHRVVASRSEFTVSSEIAFSNYGVQHLSAHVTALGEKPTSNFVDHVRGVEVTGVLHTRTWTGATSTGAGFEFETDGMVLPTIAARFWPLTLPHDEGVLASYFPVPEDGWPRFVPPGKGSIFPMLSVKTVAQREIVCRGLQTAIIRKRELTGFRYDHIQADEVVGTTWLNESRDDLLAFEQLGLVLIRASKQDALRFLPAEIDAANF